MKTRDGVRVRWAWPAAALLLAACASGITPIRTHYNLGAWHYSHGRLDPAISEYEEALREDPEDYRAAFNLGVARQERADESEDPASAARDRTKAGEAYRRVLELRPDEVRAEVNLASLAEAEGDPGRARDLLREAAATHPDAALVHSALGAWHLRREEWTEARAALETACRLDPGNLSSHYLLGNTCVALGDRPAARDAYERALERRPDDLATLLAIGRLEMAAGDPVAAKSLLLRVVHIRDDHLEARLLLADALEATGDMEGALVQVWAVRDLDSRPGRAGAYEDRIRDLYRRLLEEDPAGSSR